MPSPGQVLSLLRLFLLAIAAVGVASCTEVTPPYPTADLVISPGGALTLDGKPVAEKDLVRELKAVRDREPDTMVNIRVDRAQRERGSVPGYDAVYKAAQEAGIRSTNHTIYKEQQEAMRRQSLLRDVAFFGGIVLFAMLVTVPFALGAKTPFAAMRNGFLGVLITGCITAVVVVLVLGSRDRVMHALLIQILVVPYSAAAGLLTGALCALRVRLRSKSA